MRTTNKTVQNALRARNASSGIIGEYRNALRSEVQNLIQKIGDAQSYLFGQCDRLLDLTEKHGSKQEKESLFTLHRRADAALDAVSAQLRKIAGY